MKSRAAKPAQQGGKKPQQAVSLARRMAGKKGAVVQLQAEINTEDDWDKLLTKDGLIVVDVYSDWCGPCVGMVGNLKKCKLEIGGDMLHLAVAKSDDIEVLKRFRNKSEPTWMFIAGGQLVNVMFGANAPKLLRLIETELKNEQLVGKGEIQRKWYPFDQLTPEEQERFEAQERERIAEEKEEAAKQLALRNEQRNRRFTAMQDELISETVVVCMPHTITHEGCVVLPLLEPLWGQLGVYVTETSKLVITDEMWEELFYRTNTELSEDMAKNFQLGPCYALLLHAVMTPPAGISPPTEPGDIEKLVCEAINEIKLQPGQEIVEPASGSIPAEYFWKKPIVEEDKKEGGAEEGEGEAEEEEEGNEEAAEEGTCLTNIPGVYTPPTAFSKCAAVAQLFHARAEKIAVLDGSKLPPRMAIIFEPSKAEECFTLAEELESEVLGIGYFSKQDPEEAVLLAKTPQQYSKLAQSADNKLVVVVAKRRSEPMLSFAALGPVYVSPNEKTGALESDKFFPPGIEINPDEVSDWSQESEKFEDEDDFGEIETEEEEDEASVTEQELPESMPVHENNIPHDGEDGEGDEGAESELAEGGQTPTTAVTET